MERRDWMKDTWETMNMPVTVLPLEEESCQIIYQNPAAKKLCAPYASILEIMLPAEAETLLFAARGEKEIPAPLFCHIGEEVYSAVLFEQKGCQVCLLQEVSAYYKSNQRALDDAIMASQAKTSFLSEMSHDIRTPMGAIIGLTEIALSQENAPPKIRECLEKTKVASGHMMSLLNEVLDMSRIESGKIMIQPEETSVADLLHEILVVVKPQAQSANLTFHLEMNHVESEKIIADAVRLKQICLNLLSNAVKYTPAGGQIDFIFSILPEDTKGQVRLFAKVKDNGIGMSKEFLEKVFTPFEREESSTVNKIQGTGLGMAITQNLVNLMKGSIHVESKLGKGSCFSLSIPFEAVEEEEMLYVNSLSGKHVLLLDCNEKQSLTVKQMLESLHMSADIARNASEAVTLINDSVFSDSEYFAFLTAEKIPDVEMMTFLPEIRRRMGSSFPIIILSDNDFSQIEYMFTRAGADAFIPLPLFKNSLASGLYAYTKEGRQKQNKGDGKAAWDFSKKRILLVDDIEINREIALELLSDSGVTIETAENGKMAVDLFGQSAPFYYDMILMDIQMPVMNGLDAAREIRKLQREDAQIVPIIAMTANAFVEDVQNSLEAGMNAHISKPLDMEQVFSTMNIFLNR